jgi:peroxiredoxin Q/BCP
MAQLRQQYDEFVARDAEVVVIGPEDKRAFQLYWKTHKLPFIGLPDPDNQVLERFGQEVRLLKLGRLPAQLIVDKQGVVRFVHYGHSMQDIPPNDELLRLLGELNGR